MSEAKVVTLAVVTGMAEKAGVGPGRKFHIHQTGEVEFLGEMPYEEWFGVLEAFKRGYDKYHLALGSMAKYGTAHYGKEKVEAAFKQLEFPHQDAIRAMAIGQLTLNFGDTPQLDPDHYWVLGSLLEDDEKEQARWAAIADKHGLSALELKTSIEKGVITRSSQVAKSSGRGSGNIGSFEAFEMYFTQWEKRVGGRDALLHADRDVREKFLESTKEVSDLRAAVMASLEAE